MMNQAAGYWGALCKFFVRAILLINSFAVHAKIDFASPTSAINLGHGTKFNILSPSLIIDQGTIKKGGSAQIIGADVAFAYGNLASDDSQVLLRSTLKNTGPYGIVLTGDDDVLNASAGIVTENIFIKNNGNRIEGQPLFTQWNPLTLQDASTTLTLAMQSVLAGNVILNNGVVVLESDLTLGSRAAFVTNGTVKLNGYRLSLSGHTRQWLGSLLWDNARDIVLNANINLSGTWTFTGISHLNGNGNVLDLSSGGTLWIRSGSILYLTDVVLKGCGTGRIVFEDRSSQMYLSSVELQLNRSYTVTTGGIYAIGPTNVVTGTNYLVFAQNSSMTVDGIGMTYETLSFLDKFNIRPTASSDLQRRFIGYVNNGVIYRRSDRDLIRFNSNTLLYLHRSDSNALLFGDRNNSNAILFLTRNNSNTLLYFHRVDSNAIVWLDTQLQTIDHGPLDIIINSSYFKMRFDVYLSGDHKMYVNTDTRIDGGGHIINFANKQSNVLIIANNTKVEFNNVVFRNYYDEAIWLGVGSSYLFGDCTRLELLEKRQMQRQWTFNGNGLVRGFGNKLVIDSLGSIRGLPHAALTLQEVDLDSLRGYNLGLSGALSTLTLRDSAACLSSTYNFTSGNLVVEGDVRLTGTGIFNFNNNRAVSILPCSTLLLSGINFIYAPLINNRDLVSLTDKTSKLFLDGCTLQSTTTGMRLSSGTLVVNHQNTLINDGALAASEGFAFGDGNAINDLVVELHPGASLSLGSGILDYQNVD